MFSKRIILGACVIPPVASCYHAYNRYNFSQKATFAMDTDHMVLCHKKEEQQLKNHIRQ